LAAHPLRGQPERRRRDVGEQPAEDLQLALPETACTGVYASDGCDANPCQTALSSDMVFSGGWSLQLAKVTGSGKGYVASLNVPV